MLGLASRGRRLLLRWLRGQAWATQHVVHVGPRSLLSKADLAKMSRSLTMNLPDSCEPGLQTADWLSAQQLNLILTLNKTLILSLIELNPDC